MSGAKRRSASPKATAWAAANEVVTTAPAARKLASRVTTILVRPGSDRPIEANVLRPITTGLPVVIALKRCMSDFSRHGRAPREPITPLSATATIRTISGNDMPRESIQFRRQTVSSFRDGPQGPDLRCALARLRFASSTRPGMTLHSHRDLGLDVRVRVVALEHEVFIAEREDVLHITIDLHGRQRPRRTSQLQPRLLEMI